MKKIITFIVLAILIILIIINGYLHVMQILYENYDSNEIAQNDVNNISIAENTQNIDENINNEIIVEIDKENNKKEIDDWRLILVNYEHQLPEDYKIDLAYIDKSRQIDARIIDPLSQMLKDIERDGIKNVWVQSSYRDVEYQRNLFDDKIKMYLEQGLSQEDAEFLTLRAINRPGTSEHNLGLAVDFNNVKHSFDTTPGFEWLQKNAENYGFVMRYGKDKEPITKVEYEPWHWRYVGVEHAKKMNELGMCLEEYIQYLENS